MYCPEQSLYLFQQKLNTRTKTYQYYCQQMKLLRNNLLTNSQPNSPQRHQEQHKKDFIPFQRQRDSMNRLISIKASVKNKQSQQCEIKRSEKIILIQKDKPNLKKFNQFFREQNVFLENEPKIYQKSRKTLIQVMADKTENSFKKRPSTSQVNSGSISRPSSQPTLEPQFTKTQSAQLYRTFTHKSITLKRMNSINIPQIASAATSPKKSISPENSPKRKRYYEPKVNIEENMNKYPELNRFRRMQELDIKLLPDFEKKHDLFNEKMIKSKQLAYQVKANLDKIDNIYF